MDRFKHVLAIILGCVTGIIIISLGEYMLSIIYPFPADIDYKNKEAIGKAIAAMPMNVFIILLASHIIAAFGGGLVATILSKKKVSKPAIIVGCALTLAGLYNTWLLPHPLWFTIVNALVYLPAAYLGYVVMKKKPGVTTT